MTTTLTERLADWHHALAVDPTTRLVQNVALTGCDSKNGYRYAESALRAALPLYEHKPVFLDHAPDRSRPHDRSTRDLVGTIEAPRYKDGRIRADIRVLDTDSGRTFLALTQSTAPGIGMSHVVLARRSLDGATVESIEDVVSVDAVINPAATSTFRESADPAIHRYAIDAPHNLPAPTTESSQPPTPIPQPLTPELLHSLITHLTTLQSRIAALELHREQEVHALRMDALLSASDLPLYAHTDAFRRQLAAAPSDAVRHDLIRERADLLRHANRNAPTSHLRTPSEPIPSTAAFIAALKRT